MRIKRKTQTFFLSCEPTERVLQVKEEVSRLVNMEPRDIKFVGTDKVRKAMLPLMPLLMMAARL